MKNKSTDRFLLFIETATVFLLMLFAAAYIQTSGEDLEKDVSAHESQPEDLRAREWPE